LEATLRGKLSNLINAQKDNADMAKVTVLLLHASRFGTVVELQSVPCGSALDLLSCCADSTHCAYTLFPSSHSLSQNSTMVFVLYGEHCLVIAMCAHLTMLVATLLRRSLPSRVS
jgi:selenophosphate synthetase-related protein